MRDQVDAATGSPLPSSGYRGRTLREPCGSVLLFVLVLAYPFLPPAVSLDGRYSSLAGTLDHPAVSTSLARGTLFQVDQTASQDQGVLRHIRERSEDANLNRVSVYVLVAIVKKRVKAAPRASKRCYKS